MRPTVLAALVGIVHGVVRNVPCAQIDKSASSVWVDAIHHTKNFVFRVHVRGLTLQPMLSFAAAINRLSFAGAINRMRTHTFLPQQRFCQ